MIADTGQKPIAAINRFHGVEYSSETSSKPDRLPFEIEIQDGSIRLDCCRYEYQNGKDFRYHFEGGQHGSFRALL